MHKYQKLIVVMLIAVLVLSSFNCATILDGAKKPHERTSDIQWGYFVLDVLFFFPLSLIIDFADGAIYKEAPGSRTEIEQQLKDYAMKGKPAYIVRDDGCYKVELVDGNLKERKIARDELPATVWNTIEKEKTALMNAK